ncbi:hypothetical protein J2X48_002416 [Bosea sp. BE271]|uniref:hypothetical protein n=1 Tax=Bosea TaxID=85413 RepID=UPI0028582311|nr:MULTISPECIES: hypothetical protein [Bosea]MDR6828483.1 hypothetical protein [Bosea robiniae]MDR6895142.1 hypothetical protein [Bosea sp. BE109]MDR7138538.1 hypothetical protein [Bosea sp. BE168]MDR7175487.1 hypothetical protein [Bosea sp. BE271]
MTMTILESAADSAVADHISLTLLDEVNSLAAEYRRYAKATAEGILKLAEILVRAEDELDREGFTDFLKAVGLEGREATVSKHRMIGKAAERLRTLGEALPNSWTTLYQLAKLPPEQFEAIMSRVSSQMTAIELRELLFAKVCNAPPKKTEPQSTPSFRPISIRFEGGGSLQEFLEALEELKRRFSFEVDLPILLPPATGGGAPRAEPLQDAA